MPRIKLTPSQLEALAAKVREVAGITKAKTVNKDFAEGSAPPITPKTPSIAESQAEIRRILNMPKEGTPAYNRFLAQKSKQEKISSEKASKASTTISKKTYKD